MKKRNVYVDLPKAGLGNLLLIWARAKAFGELNNLQVVSSSWWGIRWGAWWRAEKRKRVYWGYFKESSLLDKVQMKLRKQLGGTNINPSVELIRDSHKNSLFIFREDETQDDLFKEIRDHRQYIKVELINLLKPKWKEKLEELEKPVISVHIRRGDFKIGNPITPNRFFIECINFIRKTVKEPWPVTVFTDAENWEIADVLAMEGVRLATPNPDILDILLMSKSRIIVLSQSSTFSYWAAFLSEAIIIKPENDWQGDLRPAEINKKRFEGKVSFSNETSVKKLEQALKSEAVSNATAFIPGVRKQS